MAKLKRFLPILIVFLLVLPTLRPLFHQGFFTMHDDQQVIRLAELDLALSQGQIPVRWVENLGFGYGYPLFNFYPPFIYYLGEIFHIVYHLSFIVSIKLVFATAFLVSAITMYQWAKYHFDKLSAITAAAFYIYAPYKAVDAYVRGALAELFTFVWLPLILLAVDKIFEPPASHKRQNYMPIWIGVLSISYAALMLTHSLIVLPFTLLTGLYIFLKVAISFNQFKKALPSLITAFVLGLGMTSFFWAPSLIEKQFTLVNDILLSEKYTYSLHYVYPSQLWNSLWGYGGSSPDALDGFTYKIGKLHVAFSLMAFFFSSYCYLQIRQKHIRKSTLTAISTTLISATLLVFSAFMTTKYSALIWDNFQPLQYLQFPWRFLTFTALFSSFLAGATIHFTQQIINNKIIIYTLLISVLCLLIVPNFKLFQPQTYLDVADSYYTSDEFAKWKISKTSFEFVPQGVETRIGESSGVTEITINKDQIGTSPYSVVSGEPQVKIVKNFTHIKQFQVTTNQSSIIRINTFNFPGWKATIDQQPVSINDLNSLKLITVVVPAGDHFLEVRLTNTKTRNISNIISLISLVLLLVTLVIYKVVHLKHK